MNISYQLIVGMESVSFFTFISCRGSTPVTDAQMLPWLRSWEKWEILKYSDVTDSGDVKFGDIIGLKNQHYGVYLSGFSNSGYVQVTTQINLQDAERWKIVSATDPNSTDVVTTADAFYLELVNSPKYPKLGGSGTIPLVSNKDADSTLRFIVTS